MQPATTSPSANERKRYPHHNRTLLDTCLGPNKENLTLFYPNSRLRGAAVSCGFHAAAKPAGSPGAAVICSSSHGQKTRSGRSPIMARHGRVPVFPCSNSG
jgi:hypothetical protein